MKVESSRRPMLRQAFEKVGNGMHYVYARMNVVASGYVNSLKWVIFRWLSLCSIVVMFH